MVGDVKVDFRRRGCNDRRNRSDPDERMAGAWSELLDHARDLGGPVPPKATRRETASFLDVPRSVEIADAADAALFGADEPSDATAEAIWQEVDDAVRQAREPLGRPQRARAALSLTSLRSSP